MTRFEQYCARQRARYGAQFVAPTGAALIDAYNKGERYRVNVRTTYPDGAHEDRWGYVALTTGWVPSFMLMRRRGQTGSSDLISERDTIIASRWIK